MTPRKVIRDIMANEHIRQVDLTNVLHVSQGRISTILRSDIQTSTFIRLVDALGYEIIVRDKKGSDTTYVLTDDDDQS